MADTQTFAEAKANSEAQLIRYAAQLKRRLQTGQIGQDYYDREMNYIRNTRLDDPSVAAWTEFLAAVDDEVNSIIDGAKQGAVIGAQAAWDAPQIVVEKAADIVTSAAENTAKGFLKTALKSAGSFTWPIVVLVIVGIILAWWAFTRGPLRDSKIKVIPV